MKAGAGSYPTYAELIGRRAKASPQDKRGCLDLRVRQPLHTCRRCGDKPNAQGTFCSPCHDYMARLAVDVFAASV